MYRIDNLLKEDQKLFHTRDLALLWGIENDNTLYTTIKRYVDKNILIPVHKGFYSTLPLDRIDTIKLGAAALSRYSYVSCEHILSLAGIIFQPINSITFVSSISKKFTIAGFYPSTSPALVAGRYGISDFLVRRLKDIYLYNEAGVFMENGVKKASLERAVADILYYNSHFHFDNRQSINWQKVRKIQKEVGYS